LKKAVFQYLKPWEKLLIFISTVMLGIILSIIFRDIAANLLGADISQMDFSDYSSMNVLRLSKIFLFISHLFTFLLPALVFVKLVSFEPWEFLRLKKPKFNWLMLLPLLFITLTILNQLLYGLNRMIDFSFVSDHFQSDLELQQAFSDKRIFAFIGGTWKSFFYNLILIAIVPAVGEELTFRGVLQHLFVKGTRNMHVGIFMSAALFTLIHFQPFNVFPIFALGLCYGYIAAIMGSLWYTIILHFMNNALNVLLMHLQVIYPDYNWDGVSAGIMITFLIIGLVAMIYIVTSKKLKSSWAATSGIYMR
jgi:membrane protease YdiL (CAAX protease family)